jgi:hypothetical protein
MSDLLGRAYSVAKGYLDNARERLETVDAQAQEEMRRALPREGGDVPPQAPTSGRVGTSEETDPFARAAAKIAAAQAQAGAQRQELERRDQATTPPPDPVATAYKIIGVPAGSDFETVRAAVDQLRARCAPARFPDGSNEQAEARVILQRVEEAFHVLQNALPAQNGSRFDKLEL